MGVDFDIKTNHNVTLRGNVINVDGRDLAMTEFVAAVQFCEASGGLRVLRTPADHAFGGFCAAADKGDVVGAVRNLVLLNQHAMPSCAVAPHSNPSLDDMPQRSGMPGAARAVADVVLREEPAGAERDRSVADLRQYADRGEACLLLRSTMVAVGKQAGANEAQFLPEAKKRIAAAVSRYRPRLAIEPVLEQDLEPALDYLDGASQKGVESRRRNQSNRKQQTEALSNKLLAEGREQGRREAATVFTDKLTGIIGDQNDKGDKGDKGK